MLQVIPSNTRYRAEHGWLDTRWHFSFGDYYDPQNIHWGALRVFHDDIIRGGGAFGMHPHRDMEIITYMISANYVMGIASVIAMCCDQEKCR